MPTHIAPTRPIIRLPASMPTRLSIRLKQQLRRSVPIARAPSRTHRRRPPTLVHIVRLGQRRQPRGIEHLLVRVLGEVHYLLRGHGSATETSSQPWPLPILLHLRLGACVWAFAAVFLAEERGRVGHDGCGLRGDGCDDGGVLCYARLVNFDVDFDVFFEVGECAAQGTGEGGVVELEEGADAFVVEGV